MTKKGVVMNTKKRFISPSAMLFNSLRPDNLLEQ
jgi:hypothetical protein